jgi:Flp pilus assembly protein TadG
VTIGELSTAARRKSRGQGLVEFALALPVMLVVIFGILDFGRAVYALNTISEAARTGARVAIVDQNITLVEQAANTQAVGLTLDSVNIVYSKADDSGTCQPKKIGCTVTVTVAYTYNAATPIISNIVGSIPMSAKSYLPLERVYSSP